MGQSLSSYCLNYIRVFYENHNCHRHEPELRHLDPQSLSYLWYHGERISIYQFQQIKMNLKILTQTMLNISWLFLMMRPGPKVIKLVHAQLNLA